MILGIDRAVTPVQWGYRQAREIAHLAVYKAGRSGALDHLVQQERQRALSKQEMDLACFAIGKTNEAEEQAAAEVEVVRRFTELYGPTNYEEMRTISETAPPDPLPLKQLERWLDEALPPPTPIPPLPRQESQ